MSNTKPPPGEWVEHAACADMDPDLFMPPDRVPFSIEARIACASCPVREDCLEYAMTSPVERWGLWAGTGPKERRMLHKTRLRAAS